MADTLNHKAGGPCEAANCVQPAAAADRKRDAMRQDANMNFGGLGAPGSPRESAGGFDRG